MSGMSADVRLDIKGQTLDSVDYLTTLTHTISQIQSDMSVQMSVMSGYVSLIY